MKAAVLKKWFDVELEDVPNPVPGPGEALVKISLAGVCGSDINVYKGGHMTATVPRVLGHEILGNIVSLPDDYEGPFKVGQRVLMNPVISCGICPACRRGLFNVCENLHLLGIHEDGGYAQYTKVGVEKLVSVADDTPDEVAILGEPFANGIHVMNNIDVKPTDKVFISGGATVGIYIAVCAKAAGAQRVIVSEINEVRRQYVASLGIETVNPTVTDLIKLKDELTDGGFDIVYDTSGAEACILQMPDLCRCGGKLMSLNHAGTPFQFMIGKVSFKEQHLIGNRLYSQEEFEEGVRFVEKNWRQMRLDTMVTDRLGLSEAGKALEMMISGANICKIVLDPNR